MRLAGNLKHHSRTLCKALILFSLLSLSIHALIFFGLKVSFVMSLKSITFSFYSTLGALFGSTIAHDLLGGNILKSGVKSIQTTVVNLVPTNAFLATARYLPIGSWLEYKKPDRWRDTILSTAVEKEDIAQVETILSVSSKPALYKMLLQKNWLGSGPLQDAADSLGHKPIRSRILRKIIDAIESHKRYEILSKITNGSDQPFIHSLTYVPHDTGDLDYVVEAIPEAQRWPFIDCTSPVGNTPLHLLGYNKHASIEVTSFLKQAFKEEQGLYPNELLDLQDNSYTPSALKKIYHKKMLQYHPDRASSEEDKVLSQKIIAAYKFLTEKEIRESYKPKPKLATRS